GRSFRVLGQQSTAFTVELQSYLRDKQEKGERRILHSLFSCNPFWTRSQCDSEGRMVHASEPRSLHRQYLDVSLAPKNFNSDVVRVASQEQVYFGVEHRQVREPNPIDSIWQHGTPEP